MKARNVISRIVSIALLLVVLSGSAVDAQDGLRKKIDSLFVIASSGSVMHKDMTEPAMDSIAALGADAVPYLIEKFTTRSARARWTIIWTLQRIGSDAVPDLVSGLRGSDTLIVQRICWALGDIKDTAAVMPLISVTGQQKWQVRDQAIGALGKIGDIRAEEVIVNALTDSIGQVRKAAAVATGKLALAGYEDRLVHMLGDDFYGARMSAVNTLLKLDTAVVFQTVTDSIRSSNPMVGHLGCQILGQIATGEALDTLFQLALSDNPALRNHAAVALVNADPNDSCGYHHQVLEVTDDRLDRLKIESAISSRDHEQ